MHPLRKNATTVIMYTLEERTSVSVLNLHAGSKTVYGHF